MDPKLSSLDPKLQDAYNRVMGSPPAGSPPTSDPNSSPMPPSMPQPDPALAPPSPTDTPQAVPDQFATPLAMDPMANQTPPPAPPPYQVGDPANINAPYPPPPPLADPMSPSMQSGAYPTSENAVEPQDAIPSVPAPSEPAPMPTPMISTDPTPPPAPAVDQSITPPIEPTQAPTTVQNQPSAAVIPGASTTVAFNASNSDKNIGTTPVKKGGMHVMPLIVGLGIVVLLVAYTFVWVIIFNVKVPFIPQL